MPYFDQYIMYFLYHVLYKWISIIVQQYATIYSSIIFLQTALHISGDIFTHHREHTPTVITPSGTGRTELATFRCHGGIVPTHPRQRTVANTVRPVPDAVTTAYLCSWWWVKVSPEICRAVSQKYNKTVYSRILLDNYWHYSWCTDPWT